MTYTPRTSPDHENTGWPPGIPYIVGNEWCERFSYYGMKSILYAYMAQALYPQYASVADGAADRAMSHFHLFGAATYALPMIGAILAENLLGKYRTILSLSLVYCAGHAVLAAFEGTLWGLWVGLGLIAVGAGGIKPCVSAHVGDQFGEANWFRLRTIYQIFYFSINFGSTFSMALIPWIFDWRKTKTGFLAEHAVSIAFAIPGVLMAIATVVFFMGRRVFVHKPPSPGGKLGVLDSLWGTALFMAFGHVFFTAGRPLWLLLAISAAFAALGLGIFAIRQSIHPDDGFFAVMFYSLRAWFTDGGGDKAAAFQSQTTLSPEDELARSDFFRPAVVRFGAETARGPQAVLRIMGVFVMVAFFWALFDQSGSSWVRQANLMRTVNVLGFDILPPQMQSVNPILVMLLIPVMNRVAFPLLEKRGVRVTALRRMTTGMLFAGFSFVAVALIQRRIDAEGPGQVSILWQLVPYVIITISEVLISITGLEFAYSQAPKSMKSTIMGFWLLTVALGNIFVSLLAEFGKLPLVQFFWVFAGLMFVAGVVFGVRAHYFVERDIVQD